MDVAWFFLDRGTRRGPVATDQLIAVLFGMPDSRRVRVWRAGMNDWAEAGSVAEIASKLPLPGPSVAASGGVGPAVPVHEAEAVARLYSKLVLLVGSLFVVACLVCVAEATGAPDELGALFASIGLLIAVVILVCAHRLMKLLGADNPSLWAMAMLAAGFNVLVLLAISSRAQEWCKRYGIKMGFFGPTHESLERLRRGGV